MQLKQTHRQLQMGQMGQVGQKKQARQLWQTKRVRQMKQKRQMEQTRPKQALQSLPAPLPDQGLCAKRCECISLAHDLPQTLLRPKLRTDV